MLAVAEVGGEILESIHPKITLPRAVAVAVEAILDEQRLDLRLVDFICDSRFRAKHHDREDMASMHDIVIR